MEVKNHSNSIIVTCTTQQLCIFST